MLQFKSGLLATACDFVGTYAPCQGVRIGPLAGGVVVTATNRGAVAMIGFDPRGTATETAVILPSKELATACNGIKTAEREVTIEDDMAVVTTYYKEHSTSKEVPIRRSTQPFPDISGVVRQALRFWGETPDTSTTAGRYDLPLLYRSIKAMTASAHSIVISGYQGGPLRIQREDTEIIVLLMPQTAEPIPPVPVWLSDYAHLADTTEEVALHREAAVGQVLAKARTAATVTPPHSPT